MDSKQIVVNRGYCPHCDDRIQSNYRHEFVTCSCGKSSLDGGLIYIRVVGDTVTQPLYEDDDFELIRKFHCRGSRGKDGKSELKWIPLCEMSNEHLQSAIDYNEGLSLSGKVSTRLYRQELEYREKNSIFITD
jgi:hypothetical protein